MLQNHIQRLADFVTTHEFMIQDQAWGPGAMQPVTNAFWLPALEERLPFSLPEPYRTLTLTWEWLVFEAGGIQFFPNTPHTPDSLAYHVFLDPVMARVTLTSGYFQIGRPDTGSYDPICIGPINLQQGAPIVRLDHEEILMNERIVVEKLYPSFLAFLSTPQWK